MKAIVITIGDEILIGQIVNTNAAYLGKRLFSIGIPVEKNISVPDSEKEILKEFRYAYGNFDVIIVTGGLGPTHDDITKKCISKFFKSKLTLNKGVLRQVKNIFAKRRLPMAENNIGQAMIPDVSIALTNKAGTAPGILIDKGDKVFCAVPGVPYEVEYISENSLFPYLTKKYLLLKNKKVIKQKTLHTIGIPESLLYKRIGDINKIASSNKHSQTRVAFLPSNFEVRIRITVEADNQKTADSEMKSAINKLKVKAGKYIYSYDESPIEIVVGNILKKRNLTLSIAESCTGGLVASKITDVPGSSEYFLDSFVTYSNESKAKVLGVKSSTLKAHGSVSKKTAMEMAEGVRKNSGADIGISATGIAGPTGAAKNKPVGMVWIGYSDKNELFAKEFFFTKDRLRNKEMMSKMALEILRRQLLGIN